MKRYAVSEGGHMYEHLEGEWIEYDAANARIAELRSALASATAQISELSADLASANARADAAEERASRFEQCCRECGQDVLEKALTAERAETARLLDLVKQNESYYITQVDRWHAGEVLLVEANKRIASLQHSGNVPCDAWRALQAERAETDRLRETRLKYVSMVDELESRLAAANELLAKVRGRNPDMREEPSQYGDYEVQPAPAQADDLNARVLTAEQRTMFGVPRGEL